MNTPSKPDYDVGYGRPPEHSKWKKGQSGNPNRRRKREPKRVAILIDDFFASEIVFVENGISQRCSAFEIIYLQLLNKAMAGNSRALNVLKKYSDYAASRDSSGGVRIVLNNDKYGDITKRQGLGEKNG